MRRLFGRGSDSVTKRDELLCAYLDGELSEKERTRLEARLSQEPALRAELRALDRTMSLTGDLPEVEAPRNFILTESMVGRAEPVADHQTPRARAWAAPLLTAATAVVSLVFVIVLVGDLLSPGLGDMASAPAPRRQVEEAPKVALEAAPTQEAAAERDEEGEAASPPAGASEPRDEGAKEEPEVAAAEEVSAADATEAPEAPAQERPSGGGGAESEGDMVMEVPEVAPTVTSVTAITPTIPPEPPVVSEEEMGLVEPTVDPVEVTPETIAEVTEEREPRRVSVAGVLLEALLGLAALALIFVTVRVWRKRRP